MGLFQKFVEWGTDAKYVPLGSKCARCGKKIGFFHSGFWSLNAKQYADGVLCEDCDSKVELLLKHAPDWVKKGFRSKPPYKGYSPSKRFLMPLSSAALLLDSAERFGEEELAELGGEYHAIFRAESACNIEPTALDVGIQRAGLLQNKTVAFGFVQLGRFEKGATVLLRYGEQSLKTSILEAYAFDCEENTLDAELKAHMGKQCLSQWQNGWLVLDIDTDLPNSVTLFG